MTFVLLSGDLAVLSRVEGVATRLGQAVRSASGEAQAVVICEAEDATTVIVDLSMPSLDVASLVSRLKLNNDSGTRVVAFGPHVHEQRLAAACEAGCDLVVSRGQFFSQLESILKE
jgi:DNA-binding NarL/FixJ family response regulator